MTPLRRRILGRLVVVAALFPVVLVAIQWQETLGWLKALGLGLVAGAVTAAVTVCVFWFTESKKTKQEDDPPVGRHRR